MEFEEFLADESRTPIVYAVMTLDCCTRTFGVAPCTATGTPCYNTWHTCKDQLNYDKGTKDYEFSSSGLPVAWHGCLPMIAASDHYATEIKDSLPVNARTAVIMEDMEATDVGVDPYLDSRTHPAQGTYWKNLLARNGKNYQGRPFALYDTFLGLDKSKKRPRVAGVLDSIKRSGGKTRIELVDYLKALDDIEIPKKLNIKLAADISAGAASITLTGEYAELDPSGWVRIGDEIIQYGSISGNQLLSCTRGAWGTTAAAHSVNDKLVKCRYYEPGSGFSHLKEILLTDCAFDAAWVNSAAFDYWRDRFEEDVPLSAFLSEPIKAKELYQELLDLLDLRSWISEEMQITAMRPLPNDPDRTYATVTDRANIVGDSEADDTNPKSRITHVVVYWDKIMTAEDKKTASYRRWNIIADADAYGPYDANKVHEKKIFTRWLRRDLAEEGLLDRYVTNLGARILARAEYPQDLFDFAVEIKDTRILTGAALRVSTDEIVDPDGSPIENARFIVTKRKPQADEIKFTALRLTEKKICYIAPDDTPDYDDATEEQREYGFITGDDGRIDDRPGYFIW